MNIDDLDDFTTAYLECALWSSMDDDGVPLDTNYDIEDCSEELIKQAIEDCNSFRDGNIYLDKLDDEQAGHDFWLTRNHHGAGFWDRGYEKEMSDYLTERAQVYSGIDLYIGDDGKVYG